MKYTVLRALGRAIGSLYTLFRWNWALDCEMRLRTGYSLKEAEAYGKGEA